MRGKKYVLMLTLTILLGTIIPYVPPAKALDTVKVYVAPEFPGYIPQNTTGNNNFRMNVYIESPQEWYNSNTSGIVGWAMNIKVNETVLEPMSVYGATSGYWLFDFADGEYAGSTTLLKTVDKPNGIFYEVSEQIDGFQSPPINSSGAGGNGLLCTLRYKVLDQAAYTLIDLGYPAEGSDFLTFSYYVNFTRYDADIIIDGHYTPPPFTYMHSEGSMIDLSSPVGTSWHELYPSYSTIADLNDWSDTNGDGNLTASDFIELNTTWYTVEDVTVTIQTRNNSLTTVEEGLYNASYTEVFAAGWNNPAYAYSPNGYAWTSTDDSMQQYGNYGINVPMSVEITKVEVGMKAYSDGDEKLRFYVSWTNGSTWSGYDTSGNLPTVDPGTVTWFDFTGQIPGDIWYPQNLTDANFRTRVHAMKAGGGAMATIYLDWIPVRVTYNLGQPMYLDYEGGDASTGGFDIMRQAIANPVNTSWYEVYPSFGHKYNISDWTDTDTSADISVSDWFTWNGTLYHVEDLDTDIIITGPVEITPEFPLGLALEIGLIVAIAYVWWRSRRKTKITKQPKLAY